MKRLLDAKLLGSKLVLINDPASVARYNRCAEDVGITPTKLTSFHVDGIGWSPEVAIEKDNPHYLSHGPENPLGIIVTSSQRGCPIYRPAHSFDRSMLRAYFARNSRAITALTVTTGIGLDLDQRLGWYETLDDLVAIKSVSVSSLTGGIGHAAREQKELVREFLRTDSEAWMDKSVREGIVQSVCEHGPLYNRDLLIPEFVYTDFDDLHTIAMGGVYVFRHHGQLALVVVEDEEQLENASDDLKPFVVGTTDENIVHRVLDSEVAGIDYDWYAENIGELEKRLFTIGVMTLAAVKPELDLVSLTPPQFKRELKSCGPEATETYRELQRLCKHLPDNRTFSELPVSVLRTLLHPIRTKTRYEKNLVWRLICQIQEPVVDVMRLYAVDKNLFVTWYENQSEPLKDWVVEQIRPYQSESSS